MKLTSQLIKQITTSAAETKDYDCIESATSVSPETLNEWIQRGARQKAGLYRELVDRLKPFLAEMSKRQIPRIVQRFFAQLADLIQTNKQFETITTVWFYAIWLNDKRVPERQRLEMARQLTKIFSHPIHHGRWNVVRDELQRRASMRGRSTKSEIIDLTLTAIFVAADRLNNDQQDDPPSVLEQIYNDYRNMRRLINDISTDDLAGTEWRRNEIEFNDETVDGSIEDRYLHEAKFVLDKELREFVLQRLELLSKKDPRRLEKLIQRQRISNVKALAEKLGVDRTEMIRQVVNPARKLKRASS